MGEEIKNSAYRQKMIQNVLRQLHEGKSVEEVRQYFAEVFDGVSASEISEAEKALIAGGLPVEEVQRLCDIHAAVFKGSIQDIHTAPAPAPRSERPAETFKKENRQIEQTISQQIKPWLENPAQGISLNTLKQGIDSLSSIDAHYQRKEYMFFPFLEKHGITAPPKVMWGVDDQIRAMLKDVKNTLEMKPADWPGLQAKIKELVQKTTDMIFKEENILLPMMLENLDGSEWDRIAADMRAADAMQASEKTAADTAAVPDETTAALVEQAAGQIELPSGVFRLEELTAMLNTLPFDVTFVDKDDCVKYYTEGQDRIFARTRSIIGRHVLNCHPAKSVHVVAQIIEDFKKGIKDHEDFWIWMGGQYILIRYLAVRNQQKEYLGVLEVTQNIKPIQEISGEKRLMS